MALATGKRLGPYEILAAIGAGGMGEVYRARDTRLDRTVAIKIVKAQFAERFEREGRAISELNHPNICTLHDVGSQDGVSYLVMECVEGKPLQGPLALDEALRVAIQIASALEAAHQKGIVHRDLKPANILLTKSGVKLLDFGLAKFAQGPQRTAEVTMTAPLTGDGQILGTLQYMAPEQLEGKEADERSDIFAFGLVLYEMLTGRRAFEASSQASLIAAIMKDEPPPLATVGSVTPGALDRTLKKCLAKDPDRRCQTATDLRDELAWIAESAPALPRTVSRRGFLPFMAGGALAGAGCAGLAVWAWPGKRSTASARTIKLRIPPVEGAWPERIISKQSMAISPAGDRIAMIMNNERGAMVWVHRLNSFTTSPLPGTEGAGSVFWSPDSRFIGFWANGKLKKIPGDGGTPLPICDLTEPWSATWNDRGMILASSMQVGSWLVTVNSGAVEERRPIFWPRFLPDGKHVLYVLLDSKLGGFRAYAAEYSSGRQTELMATDSLVIFAPDSAGSTQGYLLFCRAGTLLAQRFDATQLSLSGEPVPVAEGLPFFKPAAWAAFDASADGVLAYVAGWPRSQLTWFDRRGTETGTVGAPQEFWGDLRISPDGTKLAAVVTDASKGGTDIWAFDLEKATAERVTFEPGVELAPTWSPDGTRLDYGSAQAGPPQLKVKGLYDRESGPAFPPGLTQYPFDWSANGRWILYHDSVGDNGGEVWAASVSERKIFPVLQKPLNGVHPALSPNGEYLAFAANDTGRFEIYLQRFDDSGSPRLTGDRRRISRDGGETPRWSPDGKELFFESLHHQIMAAGVKPGTPVDVGEPTVLFALPASARTMSRGQNFDVSADGQRFLVQKAAVTSELAQVVINWRQDLRL